MNISNLTRIMQCTILVMLLLFVVTLPSAAETSKNVSILNKTENSITVVDQIGRVVTVKLPVERIIATDYRQMDVLLSIGARDKFVGVDQTFLNRMPYFGLKDVPAVSVHSQEINYEYILKLNPDLVIVPTSQGSSAEEMTNKLLGVPVIVLSLSKQNVIPATEMMGEVLGKKEAANKLISWINKYNNIVEDRTKNLKPQDMPTFFYGTVTDWKTVKTDAADGCGGTNIAADLPGSTVVSSEWLLSKNPDYIFLDDMRSDMSGFNWTAEDVKKDFDNLIKERQGYSDLKAVKNNHVYLIHRDLISQPRWIVGHVYIAKLLHPDLFKDISPDEIHKEYFKEFFGIEMGGTFVYPTT